MSIHEPVIIGDATLYLGDCLEILPTLPMVATLITDPPYGIISRFGVQNKKNGVRTLSFKWDGPHVNELVINAIIESSKLSKSFFTFCGTSQISHIEAVLAGDFTVKPAVWIKSCPPPAMPGNWWPSGFEYALYGYRPNALFADTNTRRCNVFYSDTYRNGIRSAEKVAHPTQKWLPLMEHIVCSLANPGQVILDSFMGSGTTGVACINTGRKFIGIEIDPGYFEIACKRIEAAQQQARMSFADADHCVEARKMVIPSKPTCHEFVFDR